MYNLFHVFLFLFSAILFGRSPQIHILNVSKEKVTIKEHIIDADNNLIIQRQNYFAKDFFYDLFKKSPSLEGLDVKVNINRDDFTHIETIENNNALPYGFRRNWFSCRDDFLHKLRILKNDHSFEHSIIKSIFYSEDQPTDCHELLQETKTVVIGIHGSFASLSSEFLASNHPIHQSIQSFIEQTSPNGQYIGFNWSGGHNAFEIIDAAKELASLINSLKLINPNIKIIAIGHSNGGNVISAATNMIEHALEQTIQIFTPSLSEKEFSLNTAKVIQPLVIYSTGDHVQLIACYSSLSPYKNNCRYDDKISAMKLNIKINGSSPSHRDKFYIFKKLFFLANEPFDKFKIHDHLYLNLRHDDNYNFLGAHIAIKNYLPANFLHGLFKTIDKANKKKIIKQIKKEAILSMQSKEDFFEIYQKPLNKKDHLIKGVINELIHSYSFKE